MLQQIARMTTVGVTKEQPARLLFPAGDQFRTRRSSALQLLAGAWGSRCLTRPLFLGGGPTAKEGVDLRRTTLVHQDEEDKAAQFLSGKVDLAAVYTNNQVPVWEKRAGVKLTVLRPSDFDLRIPGSALISNRKVASEQPALLRKPLPEAEWEQALDLLHKSGLIKRRQPVRVYYNPALLAQPERG